MTPPMFGARGYSRNYPMERLARDARMFTIGGGQRKYCEQSWRLVYLREVPQTREGLTMAGQEESKKVCRQPNRKFVTSRKHGTADIIASAFMRRT